MIVKASDANKNVATYPHGRNTLCFGQLLSPGLPPILNIQLLLDLKGLIPREHYFPGPKWLAEFAAEGKLVDSTYLAGVVRQRLQEPFASPALRYQCPQSSSRATRTTES